MVVHTSGGLFQIKLYNSILCSKMENLQRGGSSRFLFSPNLGARLGWVISATPRPLYPREEPQYPFEEVGWAPGPVWKGFGEDKSFLSYQEFSPVSASA